MIRLKPKEKYFAPKAILFAFFFFFIFFLAGTALAGGNTSGNAKLATDGSLINFGCDNCNATVSDDKMTGYAWGQNIGWINLGPLLNGGVLNDDAGNLSGNAWGQTASWVSFKSNVGNTSHKVIIDTNTGNLDGYAWSQNYGWILFDCAGGTACVNTTWRPTTVVTPPSGGCSCSRTWTCSGFGACSDDGKQTQTCTINDCVCKTTMLLKFDSSNNHRIFFHIFRTMLFRYFLAALQV